MIECSTLFSLKSIHQLYSVFTGKRVTFLALLKKSKRKRQIFGNPLSLLCQPFFFKGPSTEIFAELSCICLFDFLLFAHTNGNFPPPHHHLLLPPLYPAATLLDPQPQDDSVFGFASRWASFSSVSCCCSLSRLPGSPPWRGGSPWIPLLNTDHE